MMASRLDAFKACTLCTRTCFESHGNQGRSEAEQLLRAPSFLKLIGDNHLPQNAGFVRLPTMFMEEHGHSIGDEVTLEGPRGWVGRVNLSYDQGYGFRGGWKQFGIHHNIEAGDYILCSLVAASSFYVKLYNKYGCEKVLATSTPHVDTFTASINKGSGDAPAFDLCTEKTSEEGLQSPPAKLGGKRKTQNEVEYVSGTGKKLCLQQLVPEGLEAENGNADVKPEDQRKDMQDMQEESPSVRDGENETLKEAEERACTPVLEGHRSEECSSSDSEKKSAEVDDGDKNVKARKKRLHRAVYETEIKRFMAMEAAQAYETTNPSTMLVVNKTAITKSQSYFSSVFARKWFPEERAQLLLMDDADNNWPVTFIPTASHMVLGAGWSRFVRGNKLEKGDVVVFELKNPNTLTLLVHIFRVKDYTYVKVANDGATKTSDSGTVPTPSKTEALSGSARELYTAGVRKDDQYLGTSENTGLKSPQSPMLPQYAAVAKYFASRGSPAVDRIQKADNGGIRDVLSQKPNESIDRKEASGVASRRGDPFVIPQQGLSFVMPLQGGGHSPSSPLLEREALSADLSEHKSVFPPQQTPQQGGSFMAMPAEACASKSFYPTGVSQQQVQFVLTQQGQMPYVMPAQLGGTFVLTPQGQVPYMMPVQEGATFMNLQHIGPQQTSPQDEKPFGSQPPPGLPKEVEFPKPVKEETPVRPRERWEIKPRRPRPPTDAERQRAMDEAFEFWTPNPHVMVTLKPSQVYAGFSLTLRCAALPDETRDATLVDSTGQSWVCKWLVNQSGRRLSAGWKRFAVDHLLEEGDVCVFEMIDRVNLTLLIHIFRVELDDYTMDPIEVKKSEERRNVAEPAKRKRKSRAKPKGLVTPLPKLPAYSGCKIENLDGSASPVKGGIMFSSMPSYKYTALQSQRRAVTTEERRRAELAARNLNTKNPSVTVVMRNSSVYCHFLVSIPSAFAKQWLPRKLVRVTLCDSGGQTSTARWAGNRKKSACLKSFREFSLSHCLEEGDALVFELMDANPNNPVFLVHVFRVVELPSTRMSPKDWEDHYKLDASVGTIKSVPLQAFQRRYDGDSRMLQAYQQLTDSEDGNDDSFTRVSRPPATLAQLSPKSKTKAIYSAILKRKTIGNGESVHSDSNQIELGEGTSWNTTHSIQGHADFYADKATHISQLERLGRQQIARDIMPLLRRMPRTDETLRAAENATNSTQALGGSLNLVSDKADTEEATHGSQSENGMTEVVHTVVPLVTKIPKVEPVEDVSPPKERTKVRRKTTQRRDAGRDDLFNINLADMSRQKAENPHEPISCKVGAEKDFTACQSECGSPRNGVTLMTGMPKVEPYEDTTAAERSNNPRREDQLESGQLGPLPLYQKEENPEDAETSAHDREIIPPHNVSEVGIAGADVGLHWLSTHPKEEPAQDGDTQESVVRLKSDELLQLDQGEGTSVALDNTTQFRHVFFGSVFDKVESEFGSHVLDVEKKRLIAAEETPSDSVECKYRWNFLSETDSTSPLDKKVHPDSNGLAGSHHPELQSTPSQHSQVKQVKGDGKMHEVHEEKLPSEADLKATHVYINGF